MLRRIYVTIAPYISKGKYFNGELKKPFFHVGIRTGDLLLYWLTLYQCATREILLEYAVKCAEELSLYFTVTHFYLNTSLVFEIYIKSTSI